MEIKDSTFDIGNLFKYIWEVIAYIVLTGERRLGQIYGQNPLNKLRIQEVEWGQYKTWKQYIGKKLAKSQTVC